MNSDYLPQSEKQDKVISSLANVVINFDLHEGEHRSNIRETRLVG